MCGLWVVREPRSAMIPCARIGATLASLEVNILQKGMRKVFPRALALR